MCDILTDNRNRTAPELRKLFEKGGGKMGATGCVSYLFDRKGLFVISSEVADEEKLMEVTLEAGAEDIASSEGSFEVVCDPDVYTERKRRAGGCGHRMSFQAGNAHPAKHG